MKTGKAYWMIPALSACLCLLAAALKTFLELAPDAPEAPKAKSLLEARH